MQILGLHGTCADPLHQLGDPVPAPRGRRWRRRPPSRFTRSIGERAVRPGRASPEGRRGGGLSASTSGSGVFPRLRWASPSHLGQRLGPAGRGRGSAQTARTGRSASRWSVMVQCFTSSFGTSFRKSFAVFPQTSTTAHGGPVGGRRVSTRPRAAELFDQRRPGRGRGRRRAPGSEDRRACATPIQGAFLCLSSAPPGDGLAGHGIGFHRVPLHVQAPSRARYRRRSTGRATK